MRNRFRERRAVYGPCPRADRSFMAGEPSVSDSSNSINPGALARLPAPREAVEAVAYHLHGTTSTVYLIYTTPTRAAGVDGLPRPRANAFPRHQQVVIRWPLARGDDADAAATHAPPNDPAAQTHFPQQHSGQESAPAPLPSVVGQPVHGSFRLPQTGLGSSPPAAAGGSQRASGYAPFLASLLHRRCPPPAQIIQLACPHVEEALIERRSSTGLIQ
jgi:hypothetical protein